MKQYEAVIKVMEKNGGYATLGFLYQETLKVPGAVWKTKTPFASMRRIVQDERFFFKIRPGLWALKDWKKKLPAPMLAGIKKETKSKEVRMFDHTYYQGLLVQIGNLQDYTTYVPAQDKNKKFLGKKKLVDMASTTKILEFTWPVIVNKIRTIDVVWFNSSKLPKAVYEVEYTTDIRNSLIKFVELQDFRTKMVIVADSRKKNKFEDTIRWSAFEPIRKHVRFLSYKQLAEAHLRFSGIEAWKSRVG